MLSAGVGACLASAWVSGCSVIYDLDTKQCSATSDCQALGGIFAEYECIENICQEPSGCTSNAQCLDQNTTEAPAVVCIERECVPLFSPECPKALPSGMVGDQYLDMLRNDPLILATTGDVGSATDPFSLNYELALREVKEKIVGIGPNASKEVVMLACDAAISDNEELDRLMDHVVNDLRIPGIATMWDSAYLQRAFNEFGGTEEVEPFFMNAFESDPVLEINFEDDDRVWSVLPSANVVARAYPPLLTQVVAHLGLAEAEVRVAVVQASGVRFLTNTMSALTQPPENFGLYFNGAGVDGNDATDHYLGVSVAARAPVPQETIDRLIDFRPHVIISAGWGEFVDFLIPGIESGWDAESDGQVRPFYILSVYNYNDPALAERVAANPALRERLAGVNGPAAVNQTIYTAYTRRWDTAFANDGVEGLRGYENFYDAAYYMIYAAAAAGGRVTNGDQLALGMGRLLNGEAVPVGPDDLTRGTTLLALGNNISLVGTLGPPSEFNPLTGARSSGFGSVYCLDAGGNYHADVLRYVPPAEGAAPTTAELSGAMPAECITTW